MLQSTRGSNHGLVSALIIPLQLDDPNVELFFKSFSMIWNVINRVILVPNDVLTPFDLRAQIFRVSMKLSGKFFFSKKCPKVTFRLEHPWPLVADWISIKTKFLVVHCIPSWFCTKIQRFQIFQKVQPNFLQKCWYSCNIFMQSVSLNFLRIYSL